jgi:gliding motility-associated lipoprotein GldD
MKLNSGLFSELVNVAKRWPWFRLSLIAVCIPVLMSCNQEDPIARPYAYARAVLPPVDPIQFTGDCLPIRFEYNAAAVPVCMDSLQLPNGGVASASQTARWMNLQYRSMGAQWHLSYHPIAGIRYADGKQIARKDALSVLMAETQRMTFKHTLKASGIEEIAIRYPANQVYGMLYVVRGDAASQTQFYVTDSVRHYLRGSLYFGVTPNSDSLEPYSAYLLEDVKRILATLRW